MFPIHNGIKLEINNNEIWKIFKYWNWKIAHLEITHKTEKKSKEKSESILNWMKVKKKKNSNLWGTANVDLGESLKH